MKRSYSGGGMGGGGGPGVGYGDSVPPPPKMPAPYPSNFSMDDFGPGDNSQGMYGPGEGYSFDSGPSDQDMTNMAPPRESRAVDRLKTMSGSSPYDPLPPASSYPKQLPPPPAPPLSSSQPDVRFSGFNKQESGSYDYGNGKNGGGGGYSGDYDPYYEGGDGGGYDQSYGQGGGGGYNQSYGQGGGGCNQSYGQNYDNYGYGNNNQETDWSYDQSGGGGSGGGGNFYSGGGEGGGRGGGRGGQRGQGRGQGRGGQGQGRGQGQGQQRGRGGQNQRGQGWNQGGGGRGQGQGRGRGGSAFGNPGQGNQGRGRGRGQGGNFGGGNNNTNQQRGRGRGGRGGGGNNNYGGGGGGFSSGNESFGSQDNSFNSSFQSNRGGSTSRGGRGGNNNYNNPRGRGTGARGGRGAGGRGGGMGPKASQVQSISENLSKMVTSGAGRGGGGGRGGRGGGRGRGDGGGGGGKPTSLMDLVDTARQRKFGVASTPAYSEEENRLVQFVEFFLKHCPDRENAIQTISNALSASRLSLKVEFEAEELIFVTKPLFTGVLTLGGFFLTRGLGLNKKAVKHDCFQRAVEILRNTPIDELLKLEDCGKDTLREEVQRQSSEDFESFKSFLSQKQAAEIETQKKIRVAAVSVSQLAERNFPLADKMMMLVKEIEKLDTKDTDAALASRLDVMCFKVGISVVALFRAVDPSNARRFHTQPYKGDPDLDLICEIYYDGVMVGKGEGRPRKQAQATAYSNIHSRLMSEPIATIVLGESLNSQPESLPDYFEIIHKGVKPMEGNNHSRLFSLKLFPPDMSRPMEEFVVIETGGETIEENAYKILEFSASKNGMLLEWKYLDKAPTIDGFRCEITLNRQKTVTGMGQSKIASRNNTSAMILTELYQTQDVISFSSKEDLSKAISMADLTKRAEELQVDGPPRAERVDCTWTESAPAGESNNKEGGEEGNKEGTQRLTEEWFANPLRLWLEDAIVEAMETYQKRVTLEELTFGPEMSQAMLRFCRAAARQCYLTLQSVRCTGYFFLHHRAVTPQEMVKILHVCKKSSGRYQLMRDKKPLSVMQQAQFVRSFPDTWLTRVKALLEAEKQKKKEEEVEESATKQEEVTKEASE